MYAKHRQELLADPFFNGASRLRPCSIRNLGSLIQSHRSDEKHCFRLDGSSRPRVRFPFFNLSPSSIMTTFQKRSSNELQRPLIVTTWTQQNLRYRRSLIIPIDSFNVMRKATGIPFYSEREYEFWQSFSLIKNGCKSSKYYMVHPLVHCWSRDRMSQADRRVMCRAAGTLLSSSITCGWSNEDYGIPLEPLFLAVKAHYEHFKEKSPLKY